MSCVYVPVFTIRLDLALCIFCIGLVYRYGFLFGRLTFFLCCLVLSMSETQSYAWVHSLVVYVFVAGPIMFPMGAVALGSICWPEVVLWNWFQWWYTFQN